MVIMASVQAFTSVLEEFLNELKETFPEEKKIATYMNSFKTMKKINSRAIMEGFMKEATKRAEMITNRDEKMLLDGKDEFMNELNVQRWWTDDLSANTKDAIWQYMNTLFMLGTTIMNIPASVLTNIESIAEQCAEQFENKEGDMSSILNGMQGMIQNLAKQNDK